MKFLALLCTFSSILPVILAGPTPAISIETVQGGKTGRHIVVLKKGVGKSDVLSKVASISGVKPGTGVTHEWDAALNGFAGEFALWTTEII
jgi:cerevisin